MTLGGLLGFNVMKILLKWIWLKLLYRESLDVKYFDLRWILGFNVMKTFIEGHSSDFLWPNDRLVWFLSTAKIALVLKETKKSCLAWLRWAILAWNSLKIFFNIVISKVHNSFRAWWAILKIPKDLYGYSKWPRHPPLYPNNHDS